MAAPPPPTTNGHIAPHDTSSSCLELDCLIIGAGFGGTYALYTLRKLGLNVHLFEAGKSLGGVWHWNRYPGARVDSEIPYYQYSIPEVWKTWNWSQRFPGHEELRAYFAHVDKVLQLSKDVTFGADVIDADFDESTAKWTVKTRDGRTAMCTYLIAATGSSYKRHYPDFENWRSYKGTIHHSAFWPEEGVDTTGKRVAIIGAGATGVQCVQEIAKEAKELSVFIRTPNISLPMGQRELTVQEQDAYKSIYKSIFKLSRQTSSGLGYDQPEGQLSDIPEEEREKHFEELWARGAFNFNVANYRDYLIDPKSNRIMYEFWAKKVRQRIKNPEKRAFLAPDEPPYAFGTKRSSLEQNYYECLDQDNVEVVALNKTPIKEFTEAGIKTEDGKDRQFDIIVLATGYDSMTGSLTGMGLRGKDGIDMKERWHDGVSTHLGMLVKGCPNMFMIYGPQGKLRTCVRIHH